MKKPVWTQPYDVNSLVLNPQKRLGLVGLLNLLQDVAWIHAGHLGHGYEAMRDQGSIWVLTRQKLVMSEWPGWGGRIRLRTWVRPIGGPVAQRDYEILAGRRKLGEGTASWLTLDAASRRPVRLNLGDNPITTRPEGTLALIPEKIPLRDDLTPAATFQVRTSDLDVNGHVNNTRYAQWILDAVPPESHRAFRITQYEANFLAETGVGDRVVIEQGEADPSTGAVRDLQFQGRREADGKPVFAARLKVVRQCCS